MPKTYTLVFDLPRGVILNANSMPKNIFDKSKRAGLLRRMGGEATVAIHPDPESSAALLENAQAREKFKKTKGALVKKMRKMGGDEAEIEQKVQEFERESPIEGRDILDEYPLSKFTLMVTVFSPTKRLLDPPNFAPTVKHLLDGAIDAGIAKDDSYHYLLCTSFRYGGLSGSKDFRIQLDFREEC